MKYSQKAAITTISSIPNRSVLNTYRSSTATHMISTTKQLLRTRSAFCSLRRNFQTKDDLTVSTKLTATPSSTVRGVAAPHAESFYFNDSRIFSMVSLP